MNNDETPETLEDQKALPEKKPAGGKTLGVIAFLVVIGLIACVAIVIIKYAPKGFSSLASIAQSVQNYGAEVANKDETEGFTLTSTTTAAKAGDPVVLNWKKLEPAGTYSFEYTCEDGVAVDLVDSEGLRSITCDTEYDLGNTDTVTIMVDSEKEEEATVDYTIAYTKKDGLDPSEFADSSLTVMNDSLAMNGDMMEKEDPEVETKPIPKTPPLGLREEPKVVRNTTPAVTVPSGYTDLVTRFVATGEINGNSFSSGRLNKNEDGAVQFTVTNEGTRTSGTWSYSVSLPGGGTYASPLQAPLMPGERATISIGFSTEEAGDYTFVIVAADTTDKNLNNNSVRKEVTIAR